MNIFNQKRVIDGEKLIRAWQCQMWMERQQPTDVKGYFMKLFKKIKSNFGNQ